MMVESLHGQVCWLAKRKLSGDPQRKLEMELVTTLGTPLSVVLLCTIFVGTKETTVLV